MWVVFEVSTGWTTEEMRFPNPSSAGEWIENSGDSWLYAIRYED